MAILRTSDLSYLKINQVLADINGLSIEDHLGKTIYDILPGVAEFIVPRIKKVLKSGKASPYFEFQAALPKTPDRIRWLMDSFFPVLREGELPEAVGVVVLDITEIKTAEAKIQKLQKQLKLENEYLRREFRDIRLTGNGD